MPDTVGAAGSSRFSPSLASSACRSGLEGAVPFASGEIIFFFEMVTLSSSTTGAGVGMVGATTCAGGAAGAPVGVGVTAAGAAAGWAAAGVGLVGVTMPGCGVAGAEASTRSFTASAIMESVLWAVLLESVGAVGAAGAGIAAGAAATSGAGAAGAAANWSI